MFCTGSVLQSANSSASQDGKENNNASSTQRSSKWRAAGLMKEKSKFFTPKKAASFSRIPFPKGTAQSSSSSQADLEASACQKSERRVGQESHLAGRGGSRDLALSSQNFDSTVPANRGLEKPVEMFETPKRGRIAHSITPGPASSAIKASVSKPQQPSTPGCNTPTAGQEPSTVSKLWTILKNGARLGLANKPAGESSQAWRVRLANRGQH